MERKRKTSLTLNSVLAAVVISLVLAGAFAFGFVSCLHLKNAASAKVRHRNLLQPGDAPAAVRVEVLTALRAFQEAYIRREPKELDPFMRRLFPENGDVLLLGTDTGESARGYHAVANFIREDWTGWGDFRFAVDDSIVWSSGDVAWTASVGTVHSPQLDRPVSLSTILTRDGRNWRFRQLHFQWDDRDPSPSDLFRPSTHLQLLKLVLHHLGAGTPHE